MPRIFDREINSESLTDRVLTVNEGELQQSFETNSCKILPERTCSNTYRIRTHIISKMWRDHRLKVHAPLINTKTRVGSPNKRHAKLDCLLERCPLHNTRVLATVQNKCPLFRLPALYLHIKSYVYTVKPLNIIISRNVTICRYRQWQNVLILC